MPMSHPFMSGLEHEGCISFSYSRKSYKWLALQMHVTYTRYLYIRVIAVLSDVLLNTIQRGGDIS